MSDGTNETIVHANDSSNLREARTIFEDSSQEHPADEVCDDLLGSKGAHWHFPITGTHGNDEKLSAAPDWCHEDEE